MKISSPSIAIQADVTNPGQFFACCGLLELAYRLWPSAQGWFDDAPGCFRIVTEERGALADLVEKVVGCEIEGLSREEREEWRELEAKGRRLRTERQELDPQEETLRSELGEKARSGPIYLCEPFSLRLDWWHDGASQQDVPKTWAGRQEVHRVARAAQEASGAIGDLHRMFDYSCVMRQPREYCSSRQDQRKKVEPFYFDSRRFAAALDAGFSLDEQQTETMAHPAVELLCLFGLQRFRPLADGKDGFRYVAWGLPLGPIAACAVVCGAVSVSPARTYQFHFRYRDNQRRYKAFSTANPLTP